MTETGRDPNVTPFTADAVNNDGYIYTTNAPLSSCLANRRMTDVSLEMAEFAAKRVIDIGCGDGTYGREVLDRAGPSLVLGIDPAEEALGIASRKAADRCLVFSVSSAYSLPCADDSFDLAYLRGVLHHMDEPVDALREALRVAPVVVVIEPNGYNLGLKVIERCSKYHVEHGEKSYFPSTLDRWVAQLGGRVKTRRWVCLVPMFSPDWIARPLKRVEPVLERLPVLRAFGCGTYAFTVVR